MSSYLLTIIGTVLFQTAAFCADTAYSTAGFFAIEGCARDVYNFNTGWRFIKSDVPNVHRCEYDDSQWELVSLPHGLELLAEESSGDRNYQGKAWYRKHFDADPKLQGRKVFVHFEAIMGRSEIWLNGERIKEHFGGYLPVIIDVSDKLRYGKSNVIAVMTDNSNDPTYAPGKPQQIMDFAYFGGIYRDCWIVAHNNTYITDPNYENEIASGGVVVTCHKASRTEAVVDIKIHLRNELTALSKGSIDYELSNSNGELKAKGKMPFKLSGRQAASIAKTFTVENPDLWSPESPQLYWLNLKVVDSSGKIIDGYKKRIGLRTIEFRGTDGFWLNSEPYPHKLMGVNRHQDFAVIGNAMPNSLHYRDVRKLKDAGVRVIRSAHYPQDPAFMDACDQLGIFVIVATPGWQFWSDNPIFGQRVRSDIRKMVRRDRNHPSVLMWEPVLNETHYPLSFAIDALNCVKQESPYSGTYSASDPKSAGSEHYPVIFSAPKAPEGFYSVSDKDRDKSKVYFTREWGDNVDDWSSNNSPSRVHRSWGETPMLIQAQHYADPPYKFTCYESFFNTSRQHIGGTIWCGFDHSRGYHPQNFFGGVMDSYRQPKYSYYMLMSQRPVTKNELVNAEQGPMVFIAHELSPFSSPDVVVYSNCDEVRLKVFENGKSYVYKRSQSELKMPCPIITFKNAYHYMELKSLARAGKRKDIYLWAEGVVDGKVVATHKVCSALKPTKLRIRVDNDNCQLEADGSDVVVVIAELTDDYGNVKRLNNDYVRFSVEGQGRLLTSTANRPHRFDWGSAPVLLQSTTVPGKIKIKAELELEGVSTAHAVELEISSVASKQKFIADNSEIERQLAQGDVSLLPRTNGARRVSAKERSVIEQQLKEVEKQQEEFGEADAKK